MRLDKYLSHNGCGTRKEVKQQIRSGKITVDGTLITDPGFLIDEKTAQVIVGGTAISHQTHHYYLLNKPAGVVSATEDAQERTVLELLPEADRKNVFPVGRLDKDTTGLLLLTDDGALAHRLLSPKHHIPKVYQAILEHPVSETDVRSFAEGLPVDPNFTALPATLVCDPKDPHRVFVTIYEGKYHQVKRMFAAIGNQVLALKRLQMGKLALDEDLPEGAYRQLKPEFVEEIFSE